MERTKPSFFTPRNKKIILCIFVYCTIIGILYGYNYVQLMKEQQAATPEYTVYIYGNVKNSANLTLSTLRGNNFTRIENEEFEMLNAFETRYNTSISGVNLYDIFIKLDILNSNSTYMQYIASDGYKSPKLPLRIVLANPGKVLLATAENGELYKTKEEGGDGPIMGAVKLDIIANDTEMIAIMTELGKADFVYNSAYKVKYVTGIQII